jgi:hypothetical protein
MVFLSGDWCSRLMVVGLVPRCYSASAVAAACIDSGASYAQCGDARDMRQLWLPGVLPGHAGAVGFCLHSIAAAARRTADGAANSLHAPAGFTCLVGQSLRIVVFQVYAGPVGFHSCSGRANSGWGCGYRNMQMQASHQLTNMCVTVCPYRSRGFHSGSGQADSDWGCGFPACI